MKKINGTCAIIAGSGQLPKAIYDYCLANKIDCQVILLTGEADEGLFKDAKTIKLPPHKISAIIDYLSLNKIHNIFLAGRVKRSNLPLLILDKHGRNLLAKIMQGGANDKNIFKVITRFLEKHHFNILSYDFIAKEHKKTGVINNVHLEPKQLQEIQRGVAIMRGVSRYDLGQALVIENGLVLGVECVEGTDELIKRCSKLQQLQKQAILIKICKVQQDRRVDLPCVGPNTIKNIAKNGYAGIVFETKKTVILHFDECCRIADKNKIFIYGT